ncbi:MAG: hypothetical protein Q9227_006684 [Pyrenula ochraceoflavens]
MKLCSVLAVLLPLAFGLVKAAPSPQGTSSGTTTCLTDSDASDIIARFSSLLTDFNETVADNLLVDDGFTDTSDSVNFLAGQPLGSVTFPSKQAFIQGAGSQANLPSVDTLNSWHTCDIIVWRFRANLTPNPSVGIDVWEVDVDKKQIKTIYAEFNSATWAQDIGVAC